MIRYLCVIFSHHPSIVLSHPPFTTFPHRPFLLFSLTSLSFTCTHSASAPAPDVYWLPEFIQEHHLMCLLSCPAFVGRAAEHNIANWSVSLPPFVRVCEVNYYYISPLSNSWPQHHSDSFLLLLSLSCHSEDSISMAKHWFETWLADPHAWLLALMSSFRFDDVANKRTLLIIWPLTLYCANSPPPNLLPLPFPPHQPLQAFFSPLSFAGDNLKMKSCLCEHKQGYTSSRAFQWSGTGLLPPLESIKRTYVYVHVTDTDTHTSSKTKILIFVIITSVSLQQR